MRALGATFACSLMINPMWSWTPPPEKEDCKPFLAIASSLADIKLQSPAIVHQSLEQGFLVLSDFGDEKLEYFATGNEGETLYKKAIDDLIALQTKLPSDGFSLFDTAHMNYELSLFTDWYLKEHLGLKSLPDLTELFACLIDNALSMPSVTIHRDYHCRNLMVQADKSIGLLDFQDMMRGPILYDIASLLKDCYVDLGQKARQRLLDYYLDNNPLCDNHFKKNCERAFDLMAAQRHLKAIGIFCRLNHRDGKPSYLLELPLVLKYLRETADNYHELGLLKDLLNEIKEN